eukprot:10350486-Heterocapsa_arctica.AAC.1
METNKHVYVDDTMDVITHILFGMWRPALRELHGSDKVPGRVRRYHSEDKSSHHSEHPGTWVHLRNRR